MNVGDIVIRRIPEKGSPRFETAIDQRQSLGMGLVLSRQIAGWPAHLCVRVYYPSVGKIYDIAESLMEVISENG